MRKNKQSTATDCVRACVTSFLDLPIEDAPDFTQCGDFWESLQGYLARKGYTMFQVHCSPGAFAAPEEDIPCIGFKALEKPIIHAVVGKLTKMGFVSTHDPSPRKVNNARLFMIGFLIPLNYGQSN